MALKSDAASVRNRAEPPRFFAGLCIERDDEIAAGRAACGAGDDLSFGDGHTTGQAVSLFLIRNWFVPDDVARPGVEGDDVCVGRAGIDLIAVDRDRALDADGRAHRQSSRVLPDQIAARGVDGLHFVAIRVDEQDAVVEERCAFIGSVRQRPAPGGSQLGDVGFVESHRKSVFRRCQQSAKWRSQSTRATGCTALAELFRQ